MIKDVIDKLKIAVFPKRCEMCGEIICFDEHLRSEERRVGKEC